MREVSGRNFGLLIAYVLPGLALLWAASPFSPEVQSLLTAVPAGDVEAPTVGGFLYITLASVAAGMLASTIRWALLDPIHHRTGIPRPAWDDSQLQKNLDAFEALVEAHFRYYQHYANSLVAMFFALAMRLAAVNGCLWGLGPTDIGILLITILYWAGSRDTLRRYYARAAFLLGTVDKEPDHDERAQL